MLISNICWQEENQKKEVKQRKEEKQTDKKTKLNQPQTKFSTVKNERYICDVDSMKIRLHSY